MTTQVLQILTELRNALNFTKSLSELYEELKFPKPSIRRVLSILKKNNIIESIDRGIYKLKLVYREVLHTKRIIETHTIKPQHKYDIDLESTCVGLVPSYASIKKIESVLNPKLIEATIEQLGYEGIYLPIEDSLITFKIMGTEIRDRVESKYNNTFEVTIDMINNVGKKYTFYTEFKVKEEEFNE